MSGRIRELDLSLGGKFRREWEYGDKGRWQGQEGTVVVYGEQGLGDEIFYAQALSDASTRAALIVDCDPKTGKSVQALISIRTGTWNEAGRASGMAGRRNAGLSLRDWFTI